MYDEEQIVRVRCNNTNKNWYSSKGYAFTKANDFIDVKAKDLPSGSAAKVHAVCDYCGEEYETQIALINKGRSVIKKDCCSKCSGKKASEISHKRRAHKYYQRLLDVCDDFGYTLLMAEDDYIDLHQQIRYICPIHGEKTAVIDNLLRGHGCSDCSYDHRFDKKRLTPEYINSVISSYDDTWLNPTEYKNTNTLNLRIRCKCGNEFTTSFANFLRAGVTRCITCSSKESNGETIIREFLEENKIDFVFNKRFSDCRDRKPLPFDFFLPDYKLCVEFDGQHHYQEFPGWTDLATVQRHDRMKDEYCEQHGIKMLRIPYYQGHHISNILKQELAI